MPLFLALARQQLADNPARLLQLLQALDRYARADRGFMRPPGQVLLQHGKTMLRSAAGSPTAASASDEHPRIIFVPSPINAPHVLDMDAECSLMGWLGDQGLSSALVDWGVTTPCDRGDTLDTLAMDRLLPLLSQLPGPVHLVGYCLGGLIALASACHAEVRSLTLIATPWHFSGYDPQRRTELGRMWAHHRPACEAMGLVPMEVMQHGFWTLSPDKLIEKYMNFGAMEPDSGPARRFVAVEDWANGGEPLPFALGEQLFEQLYGADITGQGAWTVSGVPINAANVRGPVLELASASDAIVPLACSPDLPGRQVLASGHVGMVVGSSAPHRLWPMLKDWILSHEAPN
ncbi:alpha/beta hydrolase [Blastomonas sp. RAC04]|uniref:alpha/beta hydrolase n=1 Tax=Blastomonas sp. RAC04 TaxID=1842535 RepID=UPI0009F72E9C|nr:alpha/beta hydrolase [Blastomonas sp. RAC04]